MRASRRLAASLFAPKLKSRSFTPRLRVRQLVSQSLRRLRHVSVQVSSHCAQLFTSAANVNEGSSPFEYELIDDVERLEKYQPGGYHPVSVGNTLHDRYLIVDKLGFGGYSTVWLARDTRLNRYVAIKIAVADSSPHEAQVLRALSNSGPRPTVQQLSTPLVEQARTSLPIPLDEFFVHGPNGKQACFVTLPAQYDLREASFSRIFPIDVARALSASLALSLAYVHSRGYAHGVKLPTSFDTLSIDQLREEYGSPDEHPVVRSDGTPLPPNVPPKAVVSVYLGKYAEEFTAEDTQILLSDFGGAFAPDYEQRLGEDCHTPLFARPPEALFQPKSPLQLSADIWGLAVAIWEILGMKAIFSSEFATEDKVASQQIDVLGPIPKEWWEPWEARQEFFDESSKPTPQRSAWPPIEEAFEEGVQKYRVPFKQEAFGDEEKAAILHLMRRMLTFRPEEPLSIQDVLASGWLVKWAIPAYKRCQQE